MIHWQLFRRSVHVYTDEYASLSVVNALAKASPAFACTAPVDRYSSLLKALFFTQMRTSMSMIVLAMYIDSMDCNSPDCQ